VVLLGERLIDREQLRLAHLEAALLEAAQDLAGQPAPHGIGLDQDESALSRHRRRTLLGPGFAPGGLERRKVDRRRRLDRRLAVGADLPQRLERLFAVDAGLAQTRRADRADEEALV